MKNDEILVTILPDGSLKLETDKISAANHGGAELLVRELAKFAGGTTTKRHRHGGAAHSHSHEHGKEHHH